VIPTIETHVSYYQKKGYFSLPLRNALFNTIFVDLMGLKDLLVFVF
jgi:hypothetical protein